MTIDLLGLDAKDLEWYQMAVRTVIVFFFALALVRVSGMRTFGTKSAFDVVVSITVGGVLGRCIMGHYPFFPSLTTVVVLSLLHRLVAFLSYKSEFICKLTEGSPITLFEKNQRIEKNLSRYSITDNDIDQAVRKENMDNTDKVKAIIFEPDGTISIVKKEE